MSNVFDILKERGFIAQTSHEEELRELFENEKVTFYTGYDATAESLLTSNSNETYATCRSQTYSPYRWRYYYDR